MDEVERIVAGLTKPQREAIFPGPGNPAYARGLAGSMNALERLGVVKQVNAFSSNGKRGALLTELGLRVRALLEKERVG